MTKRILPRRRRGGRRDREEASVTSSSSYRFWAVFVITLVFAWPALSALGNSLGTSQSPLPFRSWAGGLVAHERLGARRHPEKPAREMKRHRSPHVRHQHPHFRMLHRIINFDRPRARVVRSTGEHVELPSRRTYGPIIRRGSCTPKFYVLDAETGEFETYCGSTELRSGQDAGDEVLSRRDRAR